MSDDVSKLSRTIITITEHYSCPNFHGIFQNNTNIANPLTQKPLLLKIILQFAVTLHMPSESILYDR